MRLWTLVGFLAVASSIQAQELTELARKLQSSVVVLEVNEVLGEPTSTGTGFFISADGQIATNHHVIEGARSIVARTHDNKTFRVEAIVAVDEENDLAVIRAEPGNYVPLALEHSSTVETGERVVVLGNPLGLDFTLTEGIVSAVRDAGELNEPGLDVPHLQISAPISSGSSGSPVVNLSGEVVGVVVSGFIHSQNLNFAVPVALLKDLEAVAARNPEGTPLAAQWTTGLRNLALSVVFFVLLFWFVRRWTRRAS